MAEKIDKSAFASDKSIKSLMKEVEELYSNAFGESLSSPTLVAHSSCRR